MEDNSHFNSILTGQSAPQRAASPSRCVDLNAFNPTPSSSSIKSGPPVCSDTSDRPSSDAKHSLPHISLGTFNMTSSSPSSSPPIVRQTTSANPSNRNGLAKVGRHHRPVVRSQSSRISLLRQPPPSASSLTSGTDEEHFPMPDKWVTSVFRLVGLLFNGLLPTAILDLTQVRRVPHRALRPLLVVVDPADRPNFYHRHGGYYLVVATIRYLSRTSSPIIIYRPARPDAA